MKPTLSFIRNSLKNKYSAQEIESFIGIIFKHIYNYSKYELIVNNDLTLDEEGVKKIEQIVSRLENHEPIQYILGEGWFYDELFKVKPGVLIPRNETEELVDLIIKRHTGSKGKILDIGTGSGCIAISLKKHLKDFRLLACDISGEALSIARENAHVLQLELEFFNFDVLSGKPLPGQYDIIVSNPPYVTRREMQQMEPNVLDHEPHLALFVPDDDPLLFYRAIVQHAQNALVEGGSLYFEINENYGSEMLALLAAYGMKAELFNDINGKPRMLVGKKEV
jgi:release factor glutamine methyltransferase